MLALALRRAKNLNLPRNTPWLQYTIIQNLDDKIIFHMHKDNAINE